MSEGREGPATWSQRVFLLCSTAGMALVAFLLRNDAPWGCGFAIAGTIFCAICTYANWKTTYYGEREWHDYR